MLSGFQDIAIEGINNPELGGAISFIMQLQNDGSRKLMIQESGYLRDFQHIITSDVLAQHGVCAVSEKDVSDAKEFLGR